MQRRQVERHSNVSPEQIRAARAMLGWSQQDLADRSGISARTVAAVELATNTPKRKTILQLAECLEAAGVRFGRTREYWPFVALKRPAEDETALPQMVNGKT